jgi:hypothetical protein
LLGTLVAFTNFFAQALKHDASPTERDKKRFGNTESSSYFAGKNSEQSHRIYAFRAEPGKDSGYVLVLDIRHEQQKGHSFLEKETPVVKTTGADSL